jgi:hypothetical protein
VSLFALDRDARHLVMVDRTAATKARGATFAVTRVDATTGQQSVRRVPYTASPLDPETVDSTLVRIVDNAFKSDFGEKAYGTPAVALEAHRKGVYAPAFLPPFSQMAAGGDGTLWLRRWKSDQWLALGPDDRVLGEARLPTRVTLHAADRDYLWGIELDELDVPYIVTYRVRDGG